MSFKGPWWTKLDPSNQGNEAWESLSKKEQEEFLKAFGSPLDWEENKPSWRVGEKKNWKYPCGTGKDHEYWAARGGCPKCRERLQAGEDIPLGADKTT